MVKLFGLRSKRTGFDSRPRHLNFQRLVISCFQSRDMAERSLNRRLFSKHPNNQPTNLEFSRIYKKSKVKRERVTPKDVYAKEHTMEHFL